MYHVVELRVAFAMFDKDGDGSISTEEVIEVMTTLGLQPNPDLIENMIKKVDLDGQCLLIYPRFSPAFSMLRFA